MVKKIEDMHMYNRLGRIPVCDRRKDRQTSCHGIVRAMHSRRAVITMTSLVCYIDTHVGQPPTQPVVHSRAFCSHYPCSPCFFSAQPVNTVVGGQQTTQVVTPFLLRLDRSRRRIFFENYH